MLQVEWAQPSPESEQRLAVERLRSIVQQVSEVNGLMLHDRPICTGMILELKQEDNPMFSVQMRDRAGEIEPSIVSSWSPLQLQSLHNAIGSKMTALVNHGSPCDFCDIRAVVATSVNNAVARSCKVED
ncbi:hypothetical protein [Leptolyngbya sp. NIES-2104]|uniref:hypothetical protein n=1 Tax=Leptolyngbya sp. NIES-2104 TaxID=1552121 RepID=UPI000AAFAE47|nr:hypothetical protein [Leptolyngbya sp. NIES-2104]